MSRTTLSLTYGITDFSKRVHVKDLFEKFGEVQACWLPPVGRRNGEEWGYVKFKRDASAEEAFKACRRGLVDLWGVKLNVEWRTTPTNDVQHDHDFDAKGSNLLSSRDLFRKLMEKRNAERRRRPRSPSYSSYSYSPKPRRDRKREPSKRRDRKPNRGPPDSKEGGNDSGGKPLAIEDGNLALPLAADTGSVSVEVHDDRPHDKPRQHDKPRPVSLDRESPPRDRRKTNNDDPPPRSRSPLRRSRSPVRRSRSPPPRSRSPLRRSRSPPPRSPRRRSRSPRPRSRSPPPRSRSPLPPRSRRSRSPPPRSKSPKSPPPRPPSPEQPPQPPAPESEKSKNSNTYATPALRDTRDEKAGSGSGYSFAAPDMREMLRQEREKMRQERGKKRDIVD